MEKYWDIIILAAIAGFFLFRLRNVLGRRTGHEDSGSDWLKPGEPKTENRGRQLEQGRDNIIRLPDREAAAMTAEPGERDGNIGSVAEEGSDLWTTLKAVLALDQSFDAEQFLEGARAAYKMIIQAFGAGDMKSLKGLLGDDVQQSFESSIDRQKIAGTADRKEVVGIISADLVAASLEEQVAELSVKFQAEIRSLDQEVEHPDDDEDEDVAQISLTTDVWTFGRNLKSRNPNWQLIATRSVH